MYFIRYKPEEEKEPYHAPEELKRELKSLGVEIQVEAEFFPDLIARIPDDKLEAVRSLEGVVSIYDDFKFEPKGGDC